MHLFNSNKTDELASAIVTVLWPETGKNGWNSRLDRILHEFHSKIHGPAPFSPKVGVLKTTAGSSPNELVRLIKLFDGGAYGAGMVGRAAATGADDVRAGGEDVGHGARGFVRRLFVNRFEIFQNGKAGVGLDHGRKLAALAIKA